MTYNKIVFLFFTFFFLSCKTNKNIESLTGSYVSEKYSFVSKVFMALKKESYVLNSHLVLNKDSSYQLNTCGNIIKGKWWVNKDSLFLLCVENYSTKDTTLNFAIPICSDKPSVFIIKQMKQLKINKSFYSNKKKVLHNLVKQ